MTQQGRDRKQRLVKKLWHEDTKTELHLSVYTGVLAIQKEYVMAFQLLKPFLDQVLQGYIAYGEYLQSKLPLESMTLQCLYAVDPIARGH
ncbi:unnamed protein product [Boreogadus saida]